MIILSKQKNRNLKLETMDTNFEEIIEKYIYGELEGKELLDFKELLASDNDIKHFLVALFTRKENSCILFKNTKNKHQKIKCLVGLNKKN